VSSRRAAGVAIFDTMVPDDDELDREINVIERLRDPSHIRNSGRRNGAP